MSVFMVQIERSPIEDASHWHPDGEPLPVEADDAVDAAFVVAREHRLAPGRSRMIIGDRIFHPGLST